MICHQTILTYIIGLCRFTHVFILFFVCIIYLVTQECLSRVFAMSNKYINNKIRKKKSKQLHWVNVMKDLHTGTLDRMDSQGTALHFLLLTHAHDVSPRRPTRFSQCWYLSLHKSKSWNLKSLQPGKRFLQYMQNPIAQPHPLLYSPRMPLSCCQVRFGHFIWKCLQWSENIFPWVILPETT